MHVIEYLADPKCESKSEDSLFAEYRLLCSGTIFRDCVGDWTKSEGSRILLNEPLLLFATSRPFDDYPLELTLQLTVPHVEEREETKLGNAFIHAYHPDVEVVQDLASLFSLLFRRLITVGGKSSERHSKVRHVLFDRQPFPLPLATSMRRVFWRPHPLVISTTLQDQRIENHNPQPKQIDPLRMTRLLLGLPVIRGAEGLVASCRLYALALELIHDRPDISYQLLISSVETIANVTHRSFQPTDEAKLKHQQAVYDMAIGLGLDEHTGRQLAIEACKREWWATRKFKQFLIDYVDQSVWSEPDELFHKLRLENLPTPECFEQTLSKIYNARSKATHEGKPFPASATYTGGPWCSVRAGNALFRTESPFPPVVWFERIVNSALLGFWERALSQS